MVGTLEPGTTGDSGDNAARHEHAPSRPEVTVVPRAHRQLSLHGSHHVNDTGAAADFGCGIGRVSPDMINFDNAVFIARVPILIVTLQEANMQCISGS